jgi:hypothetical protein
VIASMSGASPRTLQWTISESSLPTLADCCVDHRAATSSVVAARPVPDEREPRRQRWLWVHTDTKAGLGTVDDIRLASRQWQVSGACLGERWTPSADLPLANRRIRSAARG